MAGLTEITGKKVVDKINCRYYQKMMKRMIGYMVTWTTYGTWLQGKAKSGQRDLIRDSVSRIKNLKTKSDMCEVIIMVSPATTSQGLKNLIGKDDPDTRWRG